MKDATVQLLSHSLEREHREAGDAGCLSVSILSSQIWPNQPPAGATVSEQMFPFSDEQNPLRETRISSDSLLAQPCKSGGLPHRASLGLFLPQPPPCRPGISGLLQTFRPRPGKASSCHGEGEGWGGGRLVVFVAWGIPQSYKQGASHRGFPDQPTQ